MPPSPYSPERKAEALALYAEQGPTAVQDQLGIPKNTVASWAKAAGVRTVRNQRTAEATEAIVVDGKARRAALAERLWAVAEKAVGIELSKLEKADLRDVVGARTRAVHDALLLTGDATSRTETVVTDTIDREIARLTEAMADG